MNRAGSPRVPAMRAAAFALAIAAGAIGIARQAEGAQRGYLDVIFTMFPMVQAMALTGEIDCVPVLPDSQYGLMPFTIEGDRITGMVDMPPGTGAKYIPPLPWRPPDRDTNQAIDFEYECGSGDDRIVISGRVVLNSLTGRVIRRGGEPYARFELRHTMPICTISVPAVGYSLPCADPEGAIDQFELPLKSGAMTDRPAGATFDYMLTLE